MKTILFIFVNGWYLCGNNIQVENVMWKENMCDILFHHFRLWSFLDTPMWVSKSVYFVHMISIEVLWWGCVWGGYFHVEWLLISLCVCYDWLWYFFLLFSFCSLISDVQNHSVLEPCLLNFLRNGKHYSASFITTALILPLAFMSFSFLYYFCHFMNNLHVVSIALLPGSGTSRTINCHTYNIASLMLDISLFLSGASMLNAEQVLSWEFISYCVLSLWLGMYLKPSSLLFVISLLSLLLIFFHNMFSHSPINMYCSWYYHFHYL